MLGDFAELTFELLLESFMFVSSLLILKRIVGFINVWLAELNVESLRDDLCCYICICSSLALELLLACPGLFVLVRELSGTECLSPRADGLLPRLLLLSKLLGLGRLGGDQEMLMD